MPASRTILIVEDDPSTRMLLTHTFRLAGWEICVATDLTEAGRELMTRSNINLVLLDMVLPGGDGRELLQTLRNSGRGDVPVILMTGRASQGDRIEGLRQGADDVLVKPFDHHELLARVEAVLRRYEVPSTTTESTEPLEFGGLRIDPQAHHVSFEGRAVDVTAREFSLLHFLASNPGVAHTRADLLRKVWKSSPDWQTPATVTEHIRKLREKLTVTAGSCPWIVTVRGVGYRFEG